MAVPLAISFVPFILVVTVVSQPVEGSTTVGNKVYDKPMMVLGSRPYIIRAGQHRGGGTEQ
jgi:hypothetical protein